MAITGLIPAGGKASRINGLPKFLLPNPDGHLLGTHIERMRTAGAGDIWIAASKANLPFIKPYVDDVTIKTHETGTMSGDLLAARDFCGNDTVLFGMPDTYWSYSYAYEKMLQRISEFGAQVAVGLWRIRNDQRGKLGQVDTYGDYCTQIIDKDPDCLLPWAWGAIAFTPLFWNYIKPEMPHIGTALQAAIDAGVKVWPVFMDGEYWDCGTAPEYFRMCATFAEAGVYDR